MHLIGDVQRRADGTASEDVHTAAAAGIAGGGASLPHLEQIQASFGPGHDVAGIQAHVGGAAAPAAAAIGAQAYATGDHVAFAAAPDLHTAAHEAAHVVQQRAGVHLKGGVGEEGDPYERQADAVADRVVAGESAADLLGTSSPPPSVQRQAVQRFGSKEHKQIGDEATGDSEYELDIDAMFRLTHGDIIALSGDYFPPDELLHLSTVVPPQGRMDGVRLKPTVGVHPGTCDELIYALYLINNDDPRFQKGGVWEKHSFSAGVKKNVDERYYRLAARNDDHFPRPQGKGSELDASSAGGTYRQQHENALMLAYKAGRGESQADKPVTLDQALMREATGQHFLTDSFAAGHLTTARTTIGDYWNRKYPDFGKRFVDKVVKDISAILKSEGDGLPGALPKGAIEGGVRSTINAQLAGKPLPSLGDILSLVMHDHDNAAGVLVENDVGDRWVAHGDGKLNDPVSDGGRNLGLAKHAVQLGNQDVRNAFFLGQAHGDNPLELDQVYDQVRQLVGPPAKPSDKYGAEQLVPRVVGENEYQWEVASLDVLWNTPIRKGSDETFGRLLLQTASSGTLREELVKVWQALPDEEDPLIASYGELYPAHAFKKAVLEPLKDPGRCKEFLFDVAGLR